MSDFMKVIMQGRLTKDAEEFTTNGGAKLTKCSLASNRTYTSQGESKEETVYTTWTAWGRYAEILSQYGRKGKGIIFEGRFSPSEYGSPRIWENSSGEPRAAYELTVEGFTLLPGGDGPRREEIDDVPF